MKKKKMSDLPRDVEEEVLCRIPMTSLRPVRSTCKRWNSLSRCNGFAKKHLAHLAEEEEAKKEDPLVVMMMDYRVGLMRLNLSKSTSNEEDIVKPEATLTTGLDQIDVCQIIHSDGLLLCIPKDHSRLVVWNPYWGRPRWIEQTHNHHEVDKHLYGHLDRYTYGLGYDSSSSHSYKVLRFIDCPPKFVEFKIYDFNSDSWRIIILPPRDWTISFDERGMSIKGNTYWFASSETSDSFLVCFDFTRETLSPPLPLPFEAFPWQDTLSLSSTSVTEQLVVLFQRCDTLTMEIWISTTIEHPNALSWNTKFFLSANIIQLVDPWWQFVPFASFFIDEDKKVAVVFDKNDHMDFPTHEVAYIFGVDGSFKQQVVRESSYKLCKSSGCYYVPSLLQLN